MRSEEITRISIGFQSNDLLCLINHLDGEPAPRITSNALYRSSHRSNTTNRPVGTVCIKMLTWVCQTFERQNRFHFWIFLSFISLNFTLCERIERRSLVPSSKSIVESLFVRSVSTAVLIQFFRRALEDLGVGLSLCMHFGMRWYMLMETTRQFDSGCGGDERGVYEELHRLYIDFY